MKKNVIFNLEKQTQFLEQQKTQKGEKLKIDNKDENGSYIHTSVCMYI